jgi:hypothetical protein
MNFWLWYGIVIIFINKTLNLQGIKTLLKIHIYSKMINKKMSCIETTMSIYHNKLQKNCSKIHAYERTFFWEKDMQSSFKAIILSHCILFAPTYILLWFKLGWQWWNSSLTNIVLHFLVGHGFLILQHIGCDVLQKRIM